MCPMCLAAGGFYVAGGVSAGALTTLLATKWLGKRAEPRKTGEDDEGHPIDEEPADRHARGVERRA